MHAQHDLFQPLTDTPRSRRDDPETSHKAALVAGMNDEDPLAPARGIVFAVGTSIALGILVGLWLWLT